MAADLFYALLPEHLLLVLILLLMTLEIAGGRERLAAPLFVLAAAAGGAVVAAQLASGYGAVVVPGEIAVDRLALLGKAVLFGSALLVALAFPAGGQSVKHWMLLAASLLGGLVILDSAGFIPLFMGVEMLSLPVFALIVHGRGSSVAAEGAFKYLVLSSVASALILFGVALGYGATGTLAVADFAAALAGGGAQMLAATLLLLCGFFLKAALFPFHAWAPDAYAAARLPVTAFMAAAVKATAVFALLRVFAALPLGRTTVAVVTLLAVASILFGNLAALRQGTFRRLLAYSSVAHAGYMMFALAVGEGRVEALLYYAAVYAVTTVVACAAFAQIAGEDDELAALDGAFAARPVPGLLLAACALSLAGIPPLPGLLGKLFIFKSVVAGGHLWPAVLAFAGSYLGVLYYLALVFRLFKGGELTAGEGGLRLGRGWSGLLLGAAALAVFMLIPDVFH